MIEREVSKSRQNIGEGYQEPNSILPKEYPHQNPQAPNDKTTTLLSPPPSRTHHVRKSSKKHHQHQDAHNTGGTPRHQASRQKLSTLSTSVTSSMNYMFQERWVITMVLSRPILITIALNDENVVLAFCILAFAVADGAGCHCEGEERGENFDEIYCEVDGMEFES
jgi:hypothetical protein